PGSERRVVQRGRPREGPQVAEGAGQARIAAARPGPGTWRPVGSRGRPLPTARVDGRRSRGVDRPYRSTCRRSNGFEGRRVMTGESGMLQPVPAEVRVAYAYLGAVTERPTAQLWDLV